MDDMTPPDDPTFETTLPELHTDQFERLLAGIEEINAIVGDDCDLTAYEVIDLVRKEAGLRGYEDYLEFSDPDLFYPDQDE